MQKKPASCLGCNLYRSGMGFVRPDGENTSGVIIIGSHNGTNEVQKGVPFVKYAAAGSKLEEAFKSLGKERKEFKILNVINCQPPNDKLEFMPFEYPAIAHCHSAHVGPLLAKNKNNVILALGSVPLRELTEFKNGGKKENVSALRGYVLHSEHGSVIPSYNPAFIRRGKPQYTFYLENDLRRAIAQVRNPLVIPKYNFIEHPSYDDIKSFYYYCKNNPNAPLTYDIETDDSLDTEEDERQGLFSNFITRIQFSIERDRAITFAWKDEYFKLIQLFFLLPNDKYGFNSYNFDNLRIRDKGFRLAGRLFDVMWMFKHWKPGLERALQKVASVAGYPEPWKHLSGTREEFYACHDVNSLQYIIPWLEAEMKKDGVYGSYSNVYSINSNIGESFSQNRIDVTNTNGSNGINKLVSNIHSELKRGLENEHNSTLHIEHTSSSLVNSSSFEGRRIEETTGRGCIKSSKEIGSIQKGFLGHVVEFWPILDKAREIGLAVNPEKLSNLKTTLESELLIINKELQSLVPQELKNLEPKRKEKDGSTSYGFKKPPRKPLLSAWEAYINIRDNWNARNLPEDKYSLTYLEFLNKRLDSELALQNEAKKDGKHNKNVKNYELFERPRFDELTGQWKPQWFRRLEFKPSSIQVIRYIEWMQKELRVRPDKLSQRLALRYRVPEIIDIKTKQLRKSTDGKALESLLDSTGDEVIRLIIGDKDTEGSIGQKAGIRSVQKILKNDIPNWIPAADGRVHTTWGMVAASGQLDARSPNILNASKHKPLGKIFRGVIEAPPGFIYVECDKKSFHVATMGYAANDANYIRFSQLDPHSYFTAYVAKGTMGLPSLSMGDSEILSLCKGYKKDEKWGWVRQHIAKTIVLGNQLGLGRRKIFINQNSLIADPITKKKIRPFSSIEYVGTLQAELDNLFPKVRRFKIEITKLAHKQKKLVNDFGYKQDFYEVFDYKYDKELQQITTIHGSEYEKAIAFEVQSPAFGDIRDKLLQLKELGYLDIYPFVVSIHDSFGFMFEQTKLDNFMADVYPILVSPSRVLKKKCCPEGLVVGVEVSWGRNWQPFELRSNPEGMQELKL